MASPLFEKIGKSIAKSKGPMPDPTEDEAMGDAPDDDESSESPGAALAEALGITDADTKAIDAALKSAFEKYSA